VDEAVVKAVVSVLTAEEQALGLQQPSGIGWHPLPFTTTKLLGAMLCHNLNCETGCNYMYKS